ncbi:MAG: hypothetical protein K0S32_2383 [Bacteroidetes bacterium]|jgi:putative membrane protein|nr:hypothetical protein [Bacteroidota bacterium]
MIADKKIPFSYIFNKIKFDLLYVFIIGLIVNYITWYLKYLLPEIPLPIPAFLGTSISVLLSFKISQSYDRWWEARKIWGSIVNDSRTLVIQLQSFLPKDDPLIRKISYRQIAWCYSLGQSLRDQDAKANLDQFISSEDLDELDRHNNKPLGLLQMSELEIAELYRSKKLDTFTFTQMDETFIRLCDSMGRAERIKSTVFPSTYRLFLHMTIYLFVITLSIALGDVKMYFELPLLMVISMCFFLLEKSAYHLQDPFTNRPSDTPVTTISRTIEINIKQLLKEKEIPQPFKNNDFYIM